LPFLGAALFDCLSAAMKRLTAVAEPSKLAIMISIDIISDTVCPWCYIGKRRLEKAIRERPCYEYRIGWRPFQLNPDLAVDGIDRDRYLALKFGGAERARQVYDHVRSAGEAEDISFDFDAILRQPNSFDSHRLIRWAARAGVQDGVVEQLFRRYFTEGVDIGAPKVLREIAAACGMDGGAVGRLLEDDTDRETVEEEEMVARRMGVNGVPCFIVDRRYAVSGAQDPSVLVNVFDLVAREAEQAVGAPQAAEEAAGD
jgi:predicted DsbA family dithiol-disulfide isomerase